MKTLLTGKKIWDSRKEQFATGCVICGNKVKKKYSDGVGTIECTSRKCNFRYELEGIEDELMEKYERDENFELIAQCHFCDRGCKGVAISESCPIRWRELTTRARSAGRISREEFDRLMQLINESQYASTTRHHDREVWRMYMESIYLNMAEEDTKEVVEIVSKAKQKKIESKKIMVSKMMDDVKRRKQGKKEDLKYAVC